MFENILLLYGLNAVGTIVKPFGDGLINHTWKVSTDTQNYILQKINSDVFKRPADIDKNISLIKDFLDKHYPDYLFISPVKTLAGESLLQIESGFYRLFPFVEGSISHNFISDKSEAYEAARQFGKFSKMLSCFNASELSVTIPDFHNLALRYDQFLHACSTADKEKITMARESIDFINDHKDIVDIFHQIVNHKQIPLRVIHHDTKISNILFDQNNNGLCVIDLDTVMPGYFISDIGDMMRTYLAEASEEETELSKISIRKEFYLAIYEGYMEEMKDVLTPVEKQYFTYAGKFIMLMQAMRFLTDYLQNDIYYGAKYEGHNFNRAKNQIALLKEYIKMEGEL